MHGRFPASDGTTTSLPLRVLVVDDNRDAAESLARLVTLRNTQGARRGRVHAVLQTRLTGMVDRFTSMLDCVDVAFLLDGILDQLPPAKPSSAMIARTR